MTDTIDLTKPGVRDWLAVSSCDIFDTIDLRVEFFRRLYDRSSSIVTTEEFMHIANDVKNQTKEA